MTDIHYSPTPTTPGLYVDAAGEVWRVHFPDDAPTGPTFDELLEQAIFTPEAQAARSGPFTPLLALDVPKQNLLLEALSELRYAAAAWSAEDGLPYSDLVERANALVDEIEALG